MTSLEQLLSACEFLDNNRESIDSIKSDPQWLPSSHKGHWVALTGKHPTTLRHPAYILRKGLAECIIRSAIWAGWKPPECKVVFETHFVCNREVGHEGPHAFFPVKE